MISCDWSSDVCSSDLMKAQEMLVMTPGDAAIETALLGVDRKSVV